MKKIRVRLTLAFILMIGFSVTAAGLFTGRLIEKSHMDSLKESMLRELQIMLVTLEPVFQKQNTDLQRLVQQLKLSADARVTFIGNDGKVLADSDHDPQTMDNHLNRTEVVDARKNGVGYSVRYSQTLGQNMLYVAVPVMAGGTVQGYVRLSMTLEDIEAAVFQLWTGLVLGLAVLFLIAVVISSRIAGGLTRPLEKITQVARQISNANYSSRVRLDNKDEIGELGQAINMMAESLQFQVRRITESESRLKTVLDNMASGVVMLSADGDIVLANRAAEKLLGFSERELLGKKFADIYVHSGLSELLERFFAQAGRIREEVKLHFPEELVLEITMVPLFHAGETLKGAVVVLHDITRIRQLETVRSEFVANVSHELKTPVSVIKGFAETLLKGALNDPETAASFLKIIYEESERLNRLIADILDLSRIESRRVALTFSPVELRSFTEKIMETMAPEAEKKQIRLEWEVPENIYIEADEDRLGQIMMNLLANGINYTPKGGKVKVQIDLLENENAGQERVRIVVSDTGIGIPKKDLPRIFERFYRVDKARSRSSGGTGLGLSIVKHLVELHHGKIWAESEGTDLGARFIVELPVLQEADAESMQVRDGHGEEDSGH